MGEEVRLDTLLGGAVEERFNDALQEVLQNIMDPNTAHANQRKITLEIKFKPNEDRDESDIDFQVKTALAPPKPLGSRLLIGKDKGKAVAVEYSKQIPGQVDINEIDRSNKVVSINK